MNNLNQTVSRRETLAKAGIFGAGAAALLLSARASSAQPATADTAMNGTATAETAMDSTAMADAPETMAPGGDLDIVRFALTMERLEAAFYSQVVTAHQTHPYLAPRALELTQKIAAAEASHVAALEAVLTGAGQTLPDAATYQFPGQVFVSPITFAWFAYTLEEIGIGAYLGAVGSIDSDEIRGAAASIYGAEAQHAALLRTFAGFDYAPRYYEAPLSVEQVTQLISPYIVA